MAKFTLNINDQEHLVDVAPGTSLLWVLREQLGLTGTMTWSLAATDDGGTLIDLTYHVYGFSQADISALSAAVDGVTTDSRPHRWSTTTG